MPAKFTTDPDATTGHQSTPTNCRWALNDGALAVGMAADPEDAEEDTGGREWRFALDEVGPEAESSAIEPGRPSLENVLFFAFGAITALGLLISLLP